MTENILLRNMFDRLGNSDKDFELFSADETKTWFADAAELFVKNGILQRTQPAKVIECPGCEEECMMQVEILPATDKKPAKSFIACDKRDDVGRVSVDSCCLKQWQISGKLLAKTVLKLLKLTGTPKQDNKSKQWLLGMLKGKKRNDYITLAIEDGVFLKVAGHDVPLAEVLNLKGKKLSINKKELLKLVDNPDKSSKNQRYKPSIIKREAGKLKTQERYKRWQDTYLNLKKRRPGMSDAWYSQQIAKLDIAEDCDSETIRKNMKE